MMADVVTPADGALGLVLWRALRDVYLWAGTGTRERAGCPPGPEIAERLAEARERAPDLAEAIAVFARLAAAPAHADAAALAAACHQVYEWARMEHRAELAVLFAEAAATADPASPARANEAGRECKRAALHERSAVWYQRAFRLAVGAKDREAVLHALLGYGLLMRDLGDYRQARLYYYRAARRAARTGRRAKAGAAYHNLLGISAERREYHESEQHAIQALQHYPLRHPRIPYLVHDFAVALLHCRCYGMALSLLEKVVPVIPMAERQLVSSSIARAAACLGQHDRYRSQRAEVLQLVEQYPEFGGGAMINLAEGARALRDWSQAISDAQRAVDLSRARKNAEVERAATETLASVSRFEPAPPELELPPGNRASMVIRLLSARLDTWAERRPRGGRALREDRRA